MSHLKDFIKEINPEMIKVIKVNIHPTETIATYEAAGGLVKITINGDRKLLSIDIDSTLLNLKTKKIVEDLIKVAMNLAIIKVENKIRAQMPMPPGMDKFTLT